MKPLQSAASHAAQMQERIVQNQRTIEWSQEMMTLSKKKMAQSEEKRRQTRIRIGRGADCHQRFKLRLEARVPIGLRFFALEF